MARGAGGADVGSGQCEVGLSIMIEAPERPVDRVVAVLALRAETARMGVIGRVTALTVFRGVMECRRGVACLATNRRVRTDQWEGCQTVIETDVSHPSGFRVAGLAPGSELTDVRVLGVATGAVDRQARVRAAGMAIGADQAFVCAEQGEALDLAMVEAGGRPVGDPVATAAVRPQAAHVHVLILMTAVTAGR